MADRYVTIKGRKLGLNVSSVSIYRDSISTANLISKVPKNVFTSGYTFLDVDTQEDYVVQADDPCNTVLNLSIRAANQPPTVNISGSTSANTGTSVTLTANANDPEGFPMTYLWSTGETTQSITVTSATAQTATYTVTVTDDIGDTGSDTHDIVWTVPTTTTTTQPPATTTTTQPPTPFVSINGVTAAQVNDTITLTGEDYNFTGSTWSWTGGAAAGLTSKTINISESSAGSVTYGVTVDGTYTDTHTVTWSTTPTTTTTTTQAPATTTTTTTQAPATTTTTTNAPPQTCYAHQLQYDATTTCQGNISVYYTDNSNWCSSTKLFMSSSACASDDPSGYAPAGYYTYEFAPASYEYSYWNGSSFSISQMCTPCSN